jgi:RNase P protein component
LKGWDYVLIGKEKTTEEISFKILETNLKDTLSKLHKMELKKIEEN